MGLLTYKQLSERLNIKTTTLYSLVARGEIPHIRIAKRIVRFDPETIDQWIGVAKKEDQKKEEEGPVWA